MALVFEDLGCEGAPVRVQPHEDTLLRVVAGCVRITTGDAEQVLEAGEEALIPAGASHQLSSVYGIARIITGLQPVRLGIRGR